MPFYAYEEFAYEGTKGRRKESRRDVRTALGTSSDPAPDVNATLRAARSLNDLLYDASSGEYELVLRKRRGMTDETFDLGEVLRSYREVKEAREAVMAR